MILRVICVAIALLVASPSFAATVTTAVDTTERDGSTGSVTSTVTGATFGTAFSGRVLCVLLGSAVGNLTSSATIAGVSAVVTNFSGGVISIACALVPTGTSGSIVVTYPSADQAISLAVISVSGAVNASPSATLTSGVGGNLAVSAGGSIIALVFKNTAGAGTWSGLPTVYVTNTNILGAGLVGSGAGLDSSTSQTVTIGYSGGNSIVAVALSPSGGGGGSTTRRSLTGVGN